MTILELNKTNFEQVVTGNNIVLVDFWAPWCGPCRTFGPVFENASKTNADLVFAKVNTDEETELATLLQIRSIPTLMIFREQVLLYAEPGALPATLFGELIQRVRDIDMGEVRRRLSEAERKAGGAQDDPAPD